MSEPAVNTELNGVAAVLPVLTYAQQEKRWEKGVLWLVWIVCGAAVLQIPYVVAVDWEIIDRIPQLLAAKRTPMQVFLTLIMVGGRALVILGLAGLTMVGIFVMRGGPRARSALRAILWIWVLGISMELFTRVGSRVEEGFFSYSENPWAEVLNLIASGVAGVFPLILLAMVLRTPKQPKRWAAAGIWWLTAAACMTGGAGLLGQWYTDGHYEWLQLLQDLFVFETEPFGGEPFLSGQLRGIGILAGLFAFSSAYLVALWTVFGGRKGRPALLICAALLVVYALGFGGAEFYCAAYRAYQQFGRGAAMDAREFRDFASPTLACLAQLAVWLAFPLAVRVALSLSSVRQLLDARRPAAAPMKITSAAGR